jgi:hypothetical protein
MQKTETQIDPKQKEFNRSVATIAGSLLIALLN